MDAKQIRIVGIGGSMSESSTSLEALRIALEGARNQGAVVEVFDVRELALPLYDPALEPPPEVHRMANSVKCADGLLWSSPLYHGSVSGSFKNALDWLEVLGGGKGAYLNGKPVGLIATAGGVQGLQAVNSMEYMVRALRGFTVPFVVPVAQAWKGFDVQTRKNLEKLGLEIVVTSERLRLRSNK